MTGDAVIHVGKTYFAMSCCPIFIISSLSFRSEWHRAVWPYEKITCYLRLIMFP